MTSWFNLEPILEPCSIFNEIYGQSSILVGKTHTFSAVNHHHWQNLGKTSRFFHGVSKCLTRNWRWNPKILPNSTFVLSIVEDMVLFFSHFFHRPWHPVASRGRHGWPGRPKRRAGRRAARHRPRPPAARRAVPRAQSYLDINWIFLNFYSTSCYIYNVYRFYNVFNVYSTYTEYYLLNIL